MIGLPEDVGRREPQDIVVYDFEFRFIRGGEPVYLTAYEGRDDIVDTDPETFSLRLRPDEHTVEEHVILMSQVAYKRFTKRVEKAQAVIDDSGRLKLSGVSPE